ncbi:hypothetical protein SDNOR2018_00515 [Streptococcus dysgalactiae]
MKKIMNDATQIVDDMLQGLAYMHDDLVERLDGYDVIVRKAEKTGKVALISGGGSGHEPSHAGFVGEGMLSAAICGAVFTSPTPDQILEAIKAADEGAGVFMVIKNYSGDIMNFEMAQELAEMEGIDVASVVVDDDIAVENSLYTQGVVDLISEVATDVAITYVGGTEDGGIGTSFDQVQAIVDSNPKNDLLAFFDLGSARMNIEMVSDFSDKTITLNVVPIVEGAYTAAALIQAGADKDAILSQLEELAINK